MGIYNLFNVILYFPLSCAQSTVVLKHSTMKSRSCKGFFITVGLDYRLFFDWMFSFGLQWEKEKWGTVCILTFLDSTKSDYYLTLILTFKVSSISSPLQYSLLSIYIKGTSTLAQSACEFKPSLFLIFLRCSSYVSTEIVRWFDISDLEEPKAISLRISNSLCQRIFSTFPFVLSTFSMFNIPYHVLKKITWI